MKYPIFTTDASGKLVRLKGPEESGPRRDPLTVAYIAIGAARVLSFYGDALARLNMGELEFIGECIEEADALDALGYDNADALASVVWCYEVAEEYGTRIALLVLDHNPQTTINRAALRAAVIADAIKGSR